MMKKLILALMSLCIAIGMFVVTAQAEELQEGDYKYQILEDGTAELTDYTGDDAKVVIPAKIEGYDVTSIGNACFTESINLHAVIIPEGVKNIGAYAFSDCYNLDNVVIPNSVTDIGMYAFFRTAINNIQLPENMKTIDTGAFAQCEKLTEVALPDGLTDVAAYLFARCSDLQKVVIPDGIIEIKSNAFDRCTSLTGIKIPNSVNGISGYAFIDCKSLIEIEIPEGVTMIGSYAFAGCSNLEVVKLPKSLEVIAWYAFQDCGSLTSMNLPEKLSLIDHYVFRGCGDLKSIQIPNSVTQIGFEAFANCNNLKDVYYTGDSEQWNRIEMLEGNECLTNADLHFNYYMSLFADVASTEWFYDAINFVYKNNIMTGLNANTFGPYETLSRAQFAVILYSMENEPDVAFVSRFPDVVADQWYTDAVIWANKNGIITGYANTGLFGPADSINREQMAVMLHRYAYYLNYSLNKKSELSTYKDATSVSLYAQDAMQWAVGNGIITGKSNGTELDPYGKASRAECAVIIQRFMENNANPTGTWVCNERVGAPSNYAGGKVKLVLEQTVNGTKQEKTIMEGESITFPYQLKLVGAEGVISGKVYMYEFVEGTYKLRCNWPVTFTQI